jgi:hypothetical protein
MMQHRQFMAHVTVRFTKRDDGGLTAVCPEVNGFNLSGGDRRAVMRDVAPTLEALIRRNLDIHVEVHPLKYGVYWLKERADDSQDEDEIPDHLDYAIKQVAA